MYEEDMTMPECCMKCPMKAGYGCGYMRIAMTTKDMKSGRHEDCPLEEADDGWIPYTGQHIENGRYLVQIETGIIVCGTYSENGFVFPFCSDVIVAFRPLPKPYKPKEDT